MVDDIQGLRDICAETDKANARDDAPTARARKTPKDFVEIMKQPGQRAVRLKGDWVLENAPIIDQCMPEVQKLTLDGTPIDCSQLGELDTSGAVMIRRFSEGDFCSIDGNLTGVQARHENLLGVVRCTPPAVELEPDYMPGMMRLANDVGLYAEHFLVSIAHLLNFVGLVLTRVARLLKHPGALRLTPTSFQLEVVGLKALGIVGLISFLTGAVMVNQGSIQLEKFGADILVIDMLGILQLRELAVLLTSIIIAGRSGSAFCAEIGSMRLREEVDAMVTMGMNPIDVLVLPRLFALVIALPLLTFYADIVGVMGGALMAWAQLGITPPNFFAYFHTNIPVEHFAAGLIKAPVNAMVIVFTGCYQGLTVAGSADMLGLHTTRSVVQAIFLVIVLDAMFALFFTAIGL